MLAFLAFATGSAALAQTTILSVSDFSATAPYTVVLGPGASAISEPVADQQTGQSPDDLVGGPDDPGFFIGYGLLDGAEAFAFRTQLNAVGNKGAYTGNLRVGIELTGDGAVDVFVGTKTSGSASSQGIVFQVANNTSPTSNTSPSTTSIGGESNLIAFRTGAGANYDYRAQPSDPFLYSGDPDAMLTFALTLTEFNAALTNLGLPSISSSSLLRFVIFTSTQGNAINQDLYGSTNGSSSTVRFDSGGGFTEYTDPTGQPVPEPTAALYVGAIIALLLVRRPPRPTALAARLRVDVS